MPAYTAIYRDRRVVGHNNTVGIIYILLRWVNRPGGDEMYNFIIKMIRLSILMLIFVSPYYSSAANAATVTFAETGSLIPSANINAIEGSNLSVDIIGVDFTELLSGTMSFSFNPDVLLVNSVTVNDVLFSFFPEGGSLSLVTPGLWEKIAFDVDAINGDPLATGDFSIATINLTTLATGTSALSILDSRFTSTTEVLAPTLTSTNINVTPIPLPAALWFFLSGIAFMVARFKRQSC